MAIEHAQPETLTHGGAAERPGEAERPRWQRLPLGDWGRWVRDPTDLLRIAFLAGMVAELVAGSWAEALRLFLTFLVCLVPRMLETPKLFDFAFTGAMSLQAWGNVAGTFEAWRPYHDVVHLLLTMATALLFYFVLERLRLVPDPTDARTFQRLLGIGILTFAIGSFVGAVYEEYEWMAINWLHASLIESYVHDIEDLAYNGLGAIAAAALMAVWAARHWNSRRHSEDDPLAGLLHGLEDRMARSAEPEAKEQSLAGRRRERLAHLDRGDHGAPAPRLPGVARLFAGDWTPLVRDVNDLFRLSFLAGIGVALAAGEADLAVRFALTFAATLAARWVDPPRIFDLAFNVAMAFQAWGAYAGSFPAYQAWTYFVVSLAFAVMLYLALLRLGLFPEFADDPGVHRRVAIFLASMSLGYSVGVGYALYVYFANRYLGASYETSWDLLTLRLALDWVGAIAGGLVLVAWDVYGWGNRRRLPPKRLAPAG